MYKERYLETKEKLLTDKSICKDNKDLFRKFFEFQEVKLRRMNGLPALDEPSYRTLVDYIYKFRNVNTWFNNKPIKNITKKEFAKVFNDLADGKILNSQGKPFKDLDSYIFKIFKGKLFKLAKLYEVVEESLEFYKSKDTTEARFIEEKDMFLIIEHMAKPKMKLLYTLGFDIGENVSSLIQLRKKDCRRQYNEVTKEQEYLIHLRKQTLKRARRERTEPTRLSKSVELLDFVLKDLGDEDFIFTREDDMVRDRDEKGRIIKTPPYR